MTNISELKTTNTKKNMKKAGDGRSARTTRDVQNPPERRNAWTGLTPEEMNRPGGILISWLFQGANEKGLNLTELASTLKVTHGYLSQLKKGVRQTRHISDQFVDEVASFLGVPRMAVHLASGRIRPEDVYETTVDRKSVLENALHFIQKDAAWGAMLPTEVFRAALPLQQFIVFAYEQATGATLVPNKLNVREFAESLDKMTQA